MRNGQLLHGEFSHVGVAGLGVLIMPRGEFAITRCAYKGSRGGVRISFVDGGWHKLEDFMEEVDGGTCLKYVLEYNAETFGIEPGEKHDDVALHYKSALSDYMSQPTVIRNFRRMRTNIIWFYMRYVCLVDNAGRERYYPLALVDKVPNEHGVFTSAHSVFNRFKEYEIDQQEKLVGKKFKEIIEDRCQAIAMLPATAFGPEFALQFVSGSTQAIARIRLENSWRNYYDINWRQRYMTILDFAR